MSSHRFMVERIDVTTERSFEEATLALEQIVPPVDPAVFSRLVEAHASSSEVAAAVRRAQGELELMTLAKISQGSLTSLLGTAKKLNVYLVGNPLIANRMFERHRGTGLYAPLRVALYEDPAGVAHFAYDRPSSLLGSFGDAEIDAVASVLDGKLATLAGRLGAARGGGR
ncbi:MAG TPA: DUF302 domain-containing protein [Myxococcales bacterium]|nr:DUF302 domain-containing protein [Myxococcales bacterium]